MMNWKTSLLGIATICLGLLQMIANDGSISDKVKIALPTFTAGIGLLAAKDSDK